MQLRTHLIIVFLGLVLASTSPIVADIVIYDVDLSGTDSTSMHELRVSGTITADTTTNILLSNTLQFYHEGVAQIGFASDTPSGAGFAWVATATELRFERTSNDNGEYLFGEPGPPLYFLSFGSGAFSHRIVYDPDAMGTTFDSVTLLPAGGASSAGFLVGTAAIPEPSACLFLVYAGLVGLGLYRGIH